MGAFRPRGDVGHQHRPCASESEGGGGAATQDVDEAGQGWASLSLRCCVSGRTLTDPASFEQCMHVAQVNHDILASRVDAGDRCTVNE